MVMKLSPSLPILSVSGGIEVAERVGEKEMEDFGNAKNCPRRDVSVSESEGRKALV